MKSGGAGRSSTHRPPSPRAVLRGFYRRIPDTRPRSCAGFSLGTVLPSRPARKINNHSLNHRNTASLQFYSANNMALV